MVGKIELVSGEPRREFLFFERGHVALNQRVQERGRLRSLRLWLLRRLSSRLRAPVTLPRKRIGGQRDPLRRSRLVQQAPVNLLATRPALSQAGQLVPFDERFPGGLPLGSRHSG